MAYSPKPGNGAQLYFTYLISPVNGSLYAGLAFKLAAASAFAPMVEVGLQVDGAVLVRDRCVSSLCGGGGSRRVYS